MLHFTVKTVEKNYRVFFPSLPIRELATTPAEVCCNVHAWVQWIQRAGVVERSRRVYMGERSQ